MITTFSQGENKFEVIDFMPRFVDDSGHNYTPPDVIRIINPIAGKVCFNINYDPQLNFAQSKTVTNIVNGHFKSNTVKTDHYESIYLYASLNPEHLRADKCIELHQREFFLLSYNQKIKIPNDDEIYLQFEKTKIYWLNWSSRGKKFAQNNTIINRSALLLKMLSYEKTGAIIAAITTSLPEVIGQERNWDYRFCWLRDASMTISTMLTVGYDYMVKHFLDFVLNSIAYKSEDIRILYSINYKQELTERSLDNLAGYKDSKPVRIGNAAFDQRQHDIFGVLLDVIYYTFKINYYHEDNADELWTVIRTLVHHVTEQWQEPDHGIWEHRGEKKHFVFSKVLSWVALDRAVKIAKLLKQEEYVKAWTKIRKKIKTDILNNAWNPEVEAFTQYYGSKDLDAAVLLMEDYGFIQANDPKYISTVKKIHEGLCQDGLMYRYTNEDDFGKSSTAFTICSFWLINSLHKIGEKTIAHKYFNNILKYSTPVGLFSEGIDIKTKELRGNFPQAYSHIALINTAIRLSNDKALSEENYLHNLFTPDVI